MDKIIQLALAHPFITGAVVIILVVVGILIYRFEDHLVFPKDRDEDMNDEYQRISDTEEKRE